MDERYRLRQTLPMLAPRLEAPNDPLGEALHDLRMTGTFYCRSELTAPWGLTMPAMERSLWFHAVTQGRCLLEGSDFGPLLLSAGDFALVPHGRGHVLRTGKKTKAPVVTAVPHAMVSERYALLQHGGGGEPTTLVCGVVRFDHPSANDLAALLPPAIHLDASTLPHSDWMESTLRLMSAEAQSLKPGGETVITRLADVLVIQAIRSWLSKDGATTRGWLGAMRDKQIGRALSGVHRDPCRAWTVAALATEAAMSRSAFAAKFNDLVGEPPMKYVARRRMCVAEMRLSEGESSVAALSVELGYESQAAFARAFKRIVGRTPGRVRAAKLRARRSRKLE